MKIQTLPGSGRIGLIEIGAEFGDPAPIKILETSKDMLLRLKPSISDGDPIKFTDFYGLENTAYVTISGVHKNININTLLDEQGVGHVEKIIVLIARNAVIGTKSKGAPSIQTGNFANGSSSAIMWINIESGAQVIGKGGDGGNGGSNQGTQEELTATDGDDGGDAIWVNGAGTVHFNNSGIVAGGGGGGGGGGGYWHCSSGIYDFCFRYLRRYGKSATGGAGNISGLTPPTLEPSSALAGVGGKIGQPGTAGENGFNAGIKHSAWGYGGSGGAAGYAVRKKSGTTVYDKVGDMRGGRE